MQAGSTPSATPPRRATNQHVDLDRRFIPVEKIRPREDIASESYLDFHEFWGSEGWEALHKKRLVVIQGELGSGKSWELKRQFEIQRAAGQAAFQVALEQLALTSWEVSLGEVEYPKFVAWKQSKDPATFYLDSVDESKLRRNADFKLAIKRCADALGIDGLRRARFIISSRITAWLPETDGAEVSSALAKPPPADPIDPDDDGDGDDDAASSKKDNDLALVQIVALSRAQVAKLAKSLKVDDVDGFLRELDRTFSWEFARRPLDVIELANYWAKHHAIGTLTELLEFSITTNLQESPQRRQEDRLTPERARAGGEALAAAAVFSRQLTFRISDGALVSDSLNPHAVLPPDWKPDEVEALLERPLFDGASFGRIRFHHRRTMEYLAACWLRRRLAEFCELDELRRLLVFEEGSRRVSRRSRAAVAAWLCAGTDPWCERLREWVLDINPSIHWRYGDPAALTPDYKRRLLAAQVQRGRERDWLWLRTQPGASVRMYDPSLAPGIAAAMLDQDVADDLRTEMVRMAYHAGPGPVRDAAFQVLESPRESNGLRVTAVAALVQLPDAAVRVRLEAFARNATELNEHISSHLLDSLPTVALDPDLLVLILSKTKRAGAAGGIKHALLRLVTDELTPDQAGPVLTRLVKLAETEPHFGTTEIVPVSQTFAWIRGSLLPVLEKLLSRPTLTSAETATAVEALFLIETKDEDYHSSEKRSAGLQDAILRHPAIRQQYFWRLVQARKFTKEPPVRHVSQFWRFFRGLRDDKSDFDWLVPDITARQDPGERLLAVRDAYLAWRSRGSLRSEWRQLIEATAADPALRKELRACQWSERQLPWLRFKSRVHEKWIVGPSSLRFWARNRIHDLRVWWWEAKLRWLLPKIERGEHFGWLHQFCDEARRKSEDYSIGSFQRVAKQRGRQVATAARNGCKRFWRRYTPPGLHEGDASTHGAQVGLAGINAEIFDGELDFARLTDAEVAQLVRYAFCDLNHVTSWFGQLAAANPRAVMAALEPTLAAAWNAETGPNGHAEVFRKLCYNQPAPECVVTRICELLLASEPRSSSTLYYAVRVLLESTSPPRRLLAKMADARVGTGRITPLDPSIWFSLWLQTDALRALPALETRLRRGDIPDLMVLVFASLNGRDMGRIPLLAKPDFLTVNALRQLIPLAFEFIRLADDLHRHGQGSYSPGPRDYAQEVRDRLPELLSEMGEGAGETLQYLADLPLLKDRRSSLLHYRDEHFDRQSEDAAWVESDVQKFADTHEAAPKTGADLFRLVRRRLASLKNRVEGGDLSPRSEVREGDLEEELRKLLARDLDRQKAGHYNVVQEAEIDRRERPDLRVEHPALPPVPIEVKWSDTPCHKLLERLENQLVGQYFRDEKITHGFFFVGRISPQTRWRHEDRLISFEDVMALLHTRARDLAARHERPVTIEVVTIDFRAPAPTP